MSSTKSSTKVRSTWGTSKTPRLSPTPARDLRFGSSAACAVFKCSLCQQFEHTDRTAGTGARVQDTRIATRFYAPTVHKLSVGLVDTYKLIKKKRHEVRRDDIFHTEEVIMDRYEIKRQLG